MLPASSHHHIYDRHANAVSVSAVWSTTKIMNAAVAQLLVPRSGSYPLFIRRFAYFLIKSDALPPLRVALWA